MTADSIESLQHQLESLKREKAALQKIISHDIRSPFNKVYALIELMKMDDDDLSPEHKGYLNNMYQSIMSGTELIRNLHDSRQIDEGKFELTPSECELVELVQKSIRHFEELAQLKEMTIHFDCEFQHAFIQSDAHYLQRCIENLISNAIKFSLKGKDSRISLTKKANNYVLTVEDNGPGINSEEINDLFIKFKKLSTSPSGSEGSTGLGLYLTHYYITKLGGSVTYQPSQGPLGSIFILQLPA